MKRIIKASIMLVAIIVAIVVIHACAPSESTTGIGDYKRLVITVTDATTGDSLEGVTLRIVSSREVAKKTDTLGRYVFDQLRESSYHISAEKTGYVSIQSEITTNKKLQETTITLDRNVSVCGIINQNKKETEGVVPSAYVCLIPTKNDNTEVKIGRSDNSGYFSFNGLPDGATYQMYVFKEGYKSSIEQPVTVPNRTAHCVMTSEPDQKIGFDNILIDFGETTNIGVLNIDAKGDKNLAWQLDCDVKWVSFDILSGTGNASVILTIDRKYLSGKNSERIAKILVAADGKSDEIWAIVSGAGSGVNIGDIVTLSVKDITWDSATATSSVLEKTLIDNAKRIGVCYSCENEMPEFPRDKSGFIELSDIDKNGEYTVHIDNLVPEKTYYVRAVVLDNKGELHYSPNVKSFSTAKEIIKPKITVSEASDVKSTSATLNAKILHSGIPVHGEIGFCYSKTKNLPTINDTRQSTEKSETNDYHLTLEGLEYRTTYYVRGYAIQNGAPVYSDNSISFTTSWVSSSVQTITPSNIGTSSATLNAAVTQKGVPEYSERGFCISTTGNPTITDRRVVNNSEEKDYSLNISNLDFDTMYYVRAYVIQDGEVIYGNLLNFTTFFEKTTLSTTSATNVSSTSATLNASIIHSGTPQYSERGFCYSKASKTPTISDNKRVVDGSGTGGFHLEICNLDAPTTYRVRSYVIQNAEVIYGNEIQFTTQTTLVEVATLSISNNDVTTSTARIYGTVTKDGMPAYSEKGICYGLSDSPTIETSFSITVSGTGIGAYSANISGLHAYTTYYARAFARSKLGIAYGNTVNFTTKTEKASVSTQAPTQLSGTSVRLNGIILNVGNPNYTEKGFVCSMNSFPTIRDTKVIVSGHGAGHFAANFRNGSNYIYTYHVRAYVINVDGSVYYGEDHYVFFDVVFTNKL